MSPEADDMGESDKEIGRRIALLREERGWSQRALAKVIAMDQAVLSRIESGKREVRAGELELLADALGVEVPDLLPGQTPGPAPSLSPPAAAGPRPAGDASASSRARFAPADAHRRRASRSRSELTQEDWYLTRSALEANMAEGLSDEGPGSSDERLSSSDDALRSSEADADALLEITGYAAFEGSARLERRLQSWMPEMEADARELVSRDAMHLPSDSSLEGPAQPGDRALPGLPALPAPADTVIADYLRLRTMRARAPERERQWVSSDSLGRRRPAGKPAGRRAAAVDWHEPRDRYARLWRHELDIGGEGPVPDLVALFEDAGIAEVVVARGAADTPVAAVVTVDLGPLVWDEGGARPSAGRFRPPAYSRSGNLLDDEASVSFLFVNAQRPVPLQRHALAHAFAHLVLGHGDVIDEQMDWSRANPIEAEANDFAEEFLAPTAAVARWYDRHGDPRPSVDVLLDLGAAFGITFWAALYRSRAAGRLSTRLFSVLNGELRERQWELLPEQSLRGGLRDTLSTLSEETPLPPAGVAGVGGVKPTRTREQGPPSAVLRVPSRLTLWTMEALRQGRLSFAEAARVLHLSPALLSERLERLGIE